MNLFKVLDISGTALLAERQRAEVVTSNLANAETTHAADGGPYKRMHVVFGAHPMHTTGFAGTLASFTDMNAEGVRVDRVVPDGAPPVRRFEPGHPDADAEGYVSYPAINPVEEIVNLMGAARAYQLNASAVQSTKSMIQASIDIIKS
ncbi:MAG TPA: flagellar basal body rod protein FlgC [Candidatus Acidoferrales bacterium]|nr:flagellar basal body rod protein FlgC [Candidatus Acidoferrales bacterium]